MIVKKKKKAAFIAAFVLFNRQLKYTYKKTASLRLPYVLEWLRQCKALHRFLLRLVLNQVLTLLSSERVTFLQEGNQWS